MAETRLTTHSKVVSARVHVRARASGRPSFERSYVGCQGCVLLRVLFRRALLPSSPPPPPPVLRKCCRKQWELTPSSASVPLKKGSGLSGRREEGVRGGAVSLGMSRPCGWLSTRSHTHTASVTTGLRQTILVYTILLACSK